MGPACQNDLFGQFTAPSIVCGVDEVGRGCIAGPVVACACFMEPGVEIPPVSDSKKLSASEREHLYTSLVQLPGLHFAFGVISHLIIDSINILQATFEAMRTALKRLPQGFDQVLVDGSLLIPGIGYSQRAIVKGDALIPVISAASILAKVFRDQMMSLYEKQFPGYGFDIHKGYGTALHLQKLKELGPSSIHRLSFAPLAKKADGQLLMLPFEEYFS